MRFARFASMFSLLFLAAPSFAQIPFPQPSIPDLSPRVVRRRPPPIPPQPGTSHPSIPWTPHPVRDPEAVAAIEASIGALGGAVSIGQVQSCIVRAEVESAAGNQDPGGKMVWEVSGNERKEAFTSSVVTAVQSTGQGSPFRVINGKQLYVASHVVRASFFPALVGLTLLRELQDANYSLRYLGTDTVGSTSVTIIRTSSQATFADADVTPQTWYFDNSTHLPLQVEYRQPDDHYPKEFVPFMTNLSDYQSVAGVLYPTRAVLLIGNSPINVMTVSVITPNANIPLTEFAASAGGVQ